MAQSRRSIPEQLLAALQEGRAQAFNDLRAQHPKVVEITGSGNEINNQILDGFRLTGMTIRDVVFVRVRFRGKTRLERVRFEECHFEGCQFLNITVQGLSLHRSRVNNCLFEELKFARVTLTGSIIVGSYFFGCNFGPLQNPEQATWEQVTIDADCSSERLENTAIWSQVTVAKEN